MSDEGKRRQDDSDDDSKLTPLEREFKRAAPNTWKQMQEEKQRQQRSNTQRGT